MSTPLELAQRIADRLSQIEGVVAVVLGGSRARGDAKSNSDIDLGIYYDATKRPSLAMLRSLAAELDDQQRGEAVTEFGEWGPWINGGAWLDVGGQRVDWLYRDLAQVEHVIAECEAGRPKVYYQPGHPHGFWNHIYMGEVFYCRSLFQADTRLAALKTRTTPYPTPLKRAMINSLWEAGFSLENCHKPAARGDTFHVAGYLYRAAAVMVQALFAANERYCINEKGSAALADTFPVRVPDFNHEVSSVLANIGTTPAQLEGSVARFEALLAQVQTVCATP